MLKKYFHLIETKLSLKLPAPKNIGSCFGSAMKGLSEKFGNGVVEKR